jgi:sterol desaturase/sphingolipid hydroxylase (fatty acid hydroxylase superfamily)
MRAPVYKNSTDARPSLGNIGLEWIVPIAVILVLAWGAMNFFGVARRYQAVALSMMVVWPVFMFSYLHDRMHLQDFWMERAPLLKNWFLRSRRLHDIHHHSLNDDGRMDRNFGIAFFVFDRLFGTLRKRHCPLNRHGYRAALRRYHLEHRSEDEFPSFPSGFRV